jgi:hypothetical protein
MDSACLPGSDREGLEVNHTMLSKYRNADDLGLKRIAATVREFFEAYQGNLYTLLYLKAEAI